MVTAVYSVDGDLSTTGTAVQAALIAGINAHLAAAFGPADVSTTLAAGSIVATSIITSPTISNVVLPDAINVVVSPGVTITATIVRAGTPSPSPAPSPSPSEAPPQDQGSAGADASDSGTIIGSIAGALVVILLIVAGAFYIIRNSSGATDRRGGAPPATVNPTFGAATLAADRQWDTENRAHDTATTALDIDGEFGEEFAV